MGLGKQLKNNIKEFRNDPHGQYWKNLRKILNISKQIGIDKKDVVVFVEEWAE